MAEKLLNHASKQGGGGRGFMVPDWVEGMGFHTLGTRCGKEQCLALLSCV